MPYWVWIIIAGSIGIFTIYILYRHFIVKKGNACSDCVNAGRCDRSKRAGRCINCAYKGRADK